MKINKKKLILFFIFLLVIITRFYFIFQTPYFHNDSYLNKRYVDNILKEGKPIFYDKLSYNGRDVVYSPVFHYVLAFFGGFVPGDLSFKIMPSIFLSLLVFVVYLLANKITNEENLSIFIALASGFIPVVFAGTLNRISVYSLILPISFYLLYVFMNFEERKSVKGFIFLTFLLALIHPSAFLLLIALIFYTVISSTEGLMISKLKKELILFSVFLILFIEFIIYQRAFLEYGMAVIWGNVPYQIFSRYFNFNFLEFIYKIGIFPLFFGLIGIIIAFYKKMENVFLLISVIFSTLLLLWFRLIDAVVGMMFLGVALIIISSIALKAVFVYLSKTKLSKYKSFFYLVVVFLLILTLIIPSFIDASSSLKEIPSKYEMLLLDWIKENALPDVTVLAPIEKGFLILDVAKKRTVIDNNFLLAPDTTQRFKDVNTIYSTKSEVEALELIKKYNVDYIFLPVEIEIKYGRVKWLYDKACFEQIFIGTPKLFKVVC